MSAHERDAGGDAGQGARAGEVRVDLGARSYDVLIGGRRLADAGSLIAERLPGARVAIVTDETVAGHHLAAIEAALAGRVGVLGSVVLVPGERTKCFSELAALCDRLLALGVERRDAVVALGGGVIGDLAGFAAAILRRGVRFVQIPTSLLAQVDSSVGGKTGINTEHGKNLVGAFHQPSLVLADTHVLATLSRREMRAGYAEVVKYGLLGDKGFFDWLEGGWQSLFGNDPSALTRAVETSCRMKAGIVSRDETETGERMLLNLGHTFGHALEAWAGFSQRLLHGEAVAIGTAQAFRYSEREGLSPKGTAARVERHLRAVGLPTRVADIPGPGKPTVGELMRLMDQDKKVAAGKLTFILVSDIGRAFIARDVPRDRIEAFLGDELAGA